MNPFKKVKFSMSMDFGRLMAIAVLGVSHSALGQALASPASDAKAQAHLLVYDSAFKGYRKYDDQPVASWRGANDLVHKLGGWKAFASDKVPDVPAESTNAPARPPSAAPAPAAAGSHKGHSTK